MNVVDVIPGRSPVILAFPHGSTEVPRAVWERLNNNGRLLADTDWHIHTLYGKTNRHAVAPYASWVQANFHRYVIDANRDPSGASLYPGQNTTGLIPVTDFDGRAIWREGFEPTESDVAERLTKFHAQYHAALEAEIKRVRAEHGVAVVYDCHSIRSSIPFLFEGKLPDFNIGTDSGRSCSREIESVTAAKASNDVGYTSALNGRFKGGWTTRHYGEPDKGIHALQMELAQSTYLSSESPPFAFDSSKAAKIQKILMCFLENLDAIARWLVQRQNRK